MPTKIDNVLSWGSDVETGTFLQAAKASRLPIIAGYVALMPDAHVGMGATVGSVIPTSGAVIPAAVGVDIGCGMIAVETDLRDDQLPDLNLLLHQIERSVPAGVGQGHSERQQTPAFLKRIPVTDSVSELTSKQVATLSSQFGTLGSGNHFVEVCLDERDRVWVVLHSGSRGIGNQLAMGHIKVAKSLARQYRIPLEDPDLAYLVEGTPEFDAYIADMLWAQSYAAANREEMMDAVLNQLFRLTPGHELRRINCHHNYTVSERHHGKDVWLTRKGAIRAGLGDEGVIPGSMGTASYIVRGLGNEASYQSSSHGAGRRMSRSQAKRDLTIDSLQTAMKGVTWNEGHAGALLDEHPDSYKDIDQVMADQADLVEIEHTLHQVLNFKGQ